MMDAICGATETKPDCAYIGQRYAGAEKYLGGARGPGGEYAGRPMTDPMLRISTDVPHVEATFRRANNIQHVPNI